MTWVRWRAMQWSLRCWQAGKDLLRPWARFCRLFHLLRWVFTLTPHQAETWYYTHGEAIIGCSCGKVWK